METGVVLRWLWADSNEADTWVKMTCKRPFIYIFVWFFEVGLSLLLYNESLQGFSASAFVLYLKQKYVACVLKISRTWSYLCFFGRLLVFSRDTVCSGILTSEFLRKVIYVWCVNSVEYCQKKPSKAGENQTFCCQIPSRVFPAFCMTWCHHVSDSELG